MSDPVRDRQRWAECGAMALTGDADGPPLAPPTTAAVALDAALAPFGLDAGVLGERAASMGLVRGGRRSCGGSSMLLEAADGWVALSLARADDLASLPATFGVGAATADDAWPRVATVLRGLDVESAAARAQLLGMAAAVVGGGPGAWTVTRVGAAPVGTPPGRPPRVVDLTALWAGPLCAHLLGRTGAEVVKVEDVARPDGARIGSPTYFDLLHHGHASATFRFADERERARLRELVEGADVVLTSARQRAIRQLGLSPETFLDGGRDRVWLAITGHGWNDDRVGFGDDAAAAAGLVAWPFADGEPRFAADAIGDPLCGAFAAEAALAAWREGGRWFIDASLSGAAGRVVGDGPTVAAERSADGAWHLGGTPVAAPQLRSSDWAQP